MRKILFAIALILTMAHAFNLQAQTVDIYPVPQEIKWGQEVAYSNSTGYTLTGEATADADAVNLFKKNPSKVVGTAPTFGEHNREVLTAFGYSAEEIDDMFAKREMNYWSAKDTAVNKALAAWGFFWSPEQSTRLGL